MNAVIVAFGIIVFGGFLAITAMLIYVIITTSRIKAEKGQPKKEIEELMDRASKKPKLMEIYLKSRERLRY
ncbi:MAG: hypothetical protein K9W46_13060 [Candidatus Heimdallarchaeum endolithica]|uniref:Uncharacterized protein n=1 Tax=Candidatus Heimdallarchaeum endolithica TaxID=2876572 RepID=A0A9Y1FP38_9ARCH|nr:MAG: hypothetical protein K9W46_13060 [Candidatus Heimdallarchaeum endolithica]